MKDKNIIFMGTPTFAVPILKKLIENYHVSLVVSQPDREKDRKGNILATPVKIVAQENNIAVYQPTNIKREYQTILDKKPDIIITCAYGQIIPKEVLNYPQYGCINIHGSLLPKLRGGAPIHHAIINGDKYTGITIMYMDEKMDTGDIIKQEKITIDDNDNLDSLYQKMSNLGAKLIIDTLPSIFNKTNQRIKQDEKEVTYGYNITKEEEKINFNLKSLDIYNKIRGLSSHPGAYCLINNKRMKVYNSKLTDIKSNQIPGKIDKIDKTGIYVNTKDKIIKLTDIKIEGKRRCLVKDFVNGINPKEYIGMILH